VSPEFTNGVAPDVGLALARPGVFFYPLEPGLADRRDLSQALDFVFGLYFPGVLHDLRTGGGIDLDAPVLERLDQAGVGDVDPHRVLVDAVLAHGLVDGFGHRIQQEVPRGVPPGRPWNVAQTGTGVPDVLEPRAVEPLVRGVVGSVPVDDRPVLTQQGVVVGTGAAGHRQPGDVPDVGIVYQQHRPQARFSHPLEGLLLSLAAHPTDVDALFPVDGHRPARALHERSLVHARSVGSPRS